MPSKMEYWTWVGTNSWVGWDKATIRSLWFEKNSVMFMTFLHIDRHHRRRSTIYILKEERRTHPLMRDIHDSVRFSKGVKHAFVKDYSREINFDTPSLRGLEMGGTDSERISSVEMRFKNSSSVVRRKLDSSLQQFFSLNMFVGSAPVNDQFNLCVWANCYISSDRMTTNPLDIDWHRYKYRRVVSLCSNRFTTDENVPFVVDCSSSGVRVDGVQCWSEWHLRSRSVRMQFVQRTMRTERSAHLRSTTFVVGGSLRIGSDRRGNDRHRQSTGSVFEQEPLQRHLESEESSGRVQMSTTEWSCLCDETSLRLRHLSRDTNDQRRAVKCGKSRLVSLLSDSSLHLVLLLLFIGEISINCRERTLGLSSWNF